MTGPGGQPAIASTERASSQEAREFAATVAAIVEHHPPRDPWKPGAAVSDADPALDGALAAAGWDDLATDERLLPLVAPAAAALGRAFASVAPVDRLLGGVLRVGDLARYATAGTLTAESLIEPRARTLWLTRASAVTPVPYTDALGIGWLGTGAKNNPNTHRPGNHGGVVRGKERMDAWVAGSAGYLAGMAGEALRLALEHARSRRAFGAPLTALEPVQQMLADAATLVDGLELLAGDEPGLDALAYAGEAAERAISICMQVTGALGFTLEFPLQRAYRRARALRAWNDGVLHAWEAPAADGAPSSEARLPLAGLRVLDFGQYVAAPFATMLLADLGADVVKVEPPGGDQWRRYDPFAPGESRYFYALNRGKRSVVLDLKTGEGRARSRELIESADALVHNCLPERAARFGLDRESVRAVNPRCVTVCVSAFGSTGPDSDRPAYDLIGQALSGLLLADPRPGDAVPRRTGGLALADFTAGLLAALSVTAGLIGRDGPGAPGLEVSLLGAALALQAQRFVEVGAVDDPPARAFAGRAELDALAARVASLETLDAYYRAHACRDGFVALACLNTAQRVQVCELFGLEDPFADNPQAAPASDEERERRETHVRAVEAGFARLDVREAVAALAARRVPASEVRTLAQLFDDEQARANGLVQEVEQPGVGPVRLLGSPFKVDGEPTGSGRPAPGLGEHADELLGERSGERFGEMPGARAR